MGRLRRPILVGFFSGELYRLNIEAQQALDAPDSTAGAGFVPGRERSVV